MLNFTKHIFAQAEKYSCQSQRVLHFDCICKRFLDTFDFSVLYFVDLKAPLLGSHTKRLKNIVAALDLRAHETMLKNCGIKR